VRGVGYVWTEYSSSELTVADKGGGSRWALTLPKSPSPYDPSRPENRNRLNAVACPAAADCIAVGFYATATQSLVTLGERWDGSGWQTLRTAGAARRPLSELNGVACVSTKDCLAVGYSQPTTSVTDFASDLPLAESWNGTKWKLLAPLAP
jgi:hypothetical protein